MISLKSLAFDVSVASSTSPFEIGIHRHIFFSVENMSGPHSTHVITLEISDDGSTWFQSSLTVTGLGFVEGTINARLVRATVTTTEAVSLVDLRFNAK